jgi:hypothetical protein
MVVGVEADAEDVGTEGVDAESQGAVGELQARGGVGGGGERDLRGEWWSEGGAETAEKGQVKGQVEAGPGEGVAGSEHSCTENRFSGVIAMQGAPKVAHF